MLLGENSRHGAPSGHGGEFGWLNQSLISPVETERHCKGEQGRVVYFDVSLRIRASQGGSRAAAQIRLTITREPFRLHFGLHGEFGKPNIG